jgi:hypothetical protein
MVRFWHATHPSAATTPHSPQHLNHQHHLRHHEERTANAQQDADDPTCDSTGKTEVLRTLTGTEHQTEERSRGHKTAEGNEYPAVAILRG